MTLEKDFEVESALQRLAALMKTAVGLTLPDSGLVQAAGRLAPRLRRLGLEGLQDYVALLGGRGAEGELSLALDLLTAPQAGFFREPAQFELLESELSRLRPTRPRLWNAAAGFGDDAYSLAMLLADMQLAGRIGADWLVLGTDIGEQRLRSAAEAIYPESRLRQVTPERLRRYTLGSGGATTGLVQMQATLRERVRFERHDLRAPLHGAQGFDAIWLRQVLVYFDAATRQTVLAQVLARLHPGGLFFVGAAEEGLVTTPGLEALGGGAFRKIV